MFNDITSGLRIPKQEPLDTKAFALNEASLADLGVDENLAFTYFERLRVICIEEGTEYEWREVLPGEEDTGLVVADFTYPSAIVVDGVTYSSRTFNFFIIQDDPTMGYAAANLGNGTTIFRTATVVGNTTTFNFKSLIPGEGTIAFIATQDTIEIAALCNMGDGDNTTVSGIGTILDPYRINVPSVTGADTIIEDSVTIDVAGTGTALDPYNLELLHTIETKAVGVFPYILSVADHAKNLFIDNGATNVTVTIPTGLTSPTTNFWTRFVKRGTGTVTFITGGGVILNIDQSITSIGVPLQAQHSWAFLERTATNLFHLTGSSPLSNITQYLPKNKGSFSGLNVGNGFVNDIFTPQGDCVSATLAIVDPENSVIEVVIANPMSSATYLVKTYIQSNGAVFSDNDIGPPVFKNVGTNTFRLSISTPAVENTQDIAIFFETYEI